MGTKFGDKEYDDVLKVLDRFEVKTMKDYHQLYLKYVLLLADVLKNSKSSLKIMVYAQDII